MDIPLIEYEEAKEDLKKQKDLGDLISNALKLGINQKKFTFSKTQVESKYKKMIDSKLLQFNDRANHYTFDFESPLIYIKSIEYANSLLKRNPSNNPYDAITFANEFLDEIKKPRTNYNWFTTTFSRNIRFYVLLECESYFIANFNELKVLLTTEQEHRSPEFDVKLYVDDVLPYYNFTTEQFWELGNAIASISEKDIFIAHEMISKVACQSHSRAKELLDIIKNKKTNSIFTVSTIIKLSNFDYDTALHESLTLLNNSKHSELEGLKCICRLAHRNKKELTNAYQIIKSHNSQSSDYWLELPTAFRILMEHKFSDDQLKNDCINEFYSLIENENVEIVNKTVNWIPYITGHEEDKMKLLYSLINRGIQIPFDTYFRKFSSPAYLFSFVKEIYLAFKLKAGIGRFTQAFGYFESKMPKEFHEGLVELISNDIGVIRKAGIDLITSKNSGSYDLNLLDLSEGRQLIIIDTLLSVPFQIEKTLPIALQLRKSSFQKVRDSLVYHLTQLVFAYEKTIMDILSINLKKDVTSDADLFSKINRVWTDYENIIKRKKGLLELNPFINQRAYAEMYYRQEREFNTEMMEEAHQNSTLLSMGLAQGISVIRGCAFKTEGNSRISKLGKIEQVTYIDKRYYINPSVYEATYRSHILLKNYKTE